MLAISGFEPCARRLRKAAWTLSVSARRVQSVRDVVRIEAGAGIWKRSLQPRRRTPFPTAVKYIPKRSAIYWYE